MGGKTIDGSFSGSQQRVFIACQRAVAHLGYTILHTDSAAGVISFNTGRSMKSWAGQDLSVTVLPSGTQCRVVVGGSLGKGGNPFGGGQVGAWGEKSALSRKFLETLAGVLPSVAEPAAAQTTLTSGLAGELERLKALLDSGAISAPEYDAAKARLLDEPGSRSLSPRQKACAGVVPAGSEAKTEEVPAEWAGTSSSGGGRI